MKNRPIEKRTFARVGMALFLATAFWELLGLFSDWPRQQFGQAEFFRSDSYAALIHLLLYTGFIAILYLFLAKFPKTPATPKQRMSFGKILGFFAASRGVAMVLAIVGAIVFLLLTMLIKGTDGIFNYLIESNPLFSTGSLISWQNMLIVCVAAPVFEEIAFRKILLDPLRPFGDKISIYFSGIAFGLMHRNIQQIFYAAALGLILGYVMVRTNNLLYCILLHFLMNVSSTVMLLFFDMRNPFQLLTVIGIYTGLLLAISVTGIILFFTYLKQIRLYPAPYRFSVSMGGGTILSIGAVLYIVLCLASAVRSIVFM